MYPPLPYLDRKCMLPKGDKGYSLEPFGKFKMPPGMSVMIPVHAMQRDPKVKQERQMQLIEYK